MPIEEAERAASASLSGASVWIELYLPWSPGRQHLKTARVDVPETL